MKKKGSLISSFVHAFRGLGLLFSSERNAQIHLFALVIVITLGFILKISTFEWIAILLCSALVISLEAINSALERMCDEIDPNFNPKIKDIKDLAAAAVLWSSLIAIGVAAIIFLPKLIVLCS